MKRTNRNKNRYPYPIGCIALGGVLAMVFSRLSPHPAEMFVLGGAVVMFCILHVLLRKGDKNHLGWRDPE